MSGRLPWLAVAPLFYLTTNSRYNRIMIKDSKVINLFDWKRMKEEEELESLRVRVEELLEEYGDELEPKMYPSVFTDDALGTIDWFSQMPTFNDKYTATGLNTHADIVLEPNIASCSKTLAWVAYILSDMGMLKASEMVDDVITELDKGDQNA